MVANAAAATAATLTMNDFLERMRNLAASGRTGSTEQRRVGALPSLPNCNRRIFARKELMANFRPAGSETFKALSGACPGPYAPEEPPLGGSDAKSLPASVVRPRHPVH